MDKGEFKLSVFYELNMAMVAWRTAKTTTEWEKVQWAGLYKNLILKYKKINQLIGT